MKTSFKNLFLLFFIFCGLVSQAQNDGRSRIERNVPLVVVESFNAVFSAKDPVWFTRYQGENNQELVYEAKFIFNNRYCKSVYDFNGNQIVFAATVDYRELPEGARKYMEEKYPFFPIVEALMVTDNENQDTYEIGVYIDNQYMIQVFSKEGDFIKNTKP
ncbi:hypothetical protein QO200_16450 [Flavobacterium sp. Arc3]|uniref:hypothetical protein n=1 Tax=Flavobacterium sp. Arc3 TaxID=3046686 RepID=UPI00352D7052